MWATKFHTHTKQQGISTSMSRVNICSQLAVVLYILIFNFLDSKLEDNRFCPEWQKTFPDFHLLLISSFDLLKLFPYIWILPPFQRNYYQTSHTQITNTAYGNVVKFTHFAMKVTDHILIHDELQVGIIRCYASTHPVVILSPVQNHQDTTYTKLQFRPEVCVHMKLLLTLMKDLKIDLCVEYLDLRGMKWVRRLRKLLSEDFHNV